MTIVRDGDDYLEPCIRVVAPFVKRIKIGVDSRSKDSSWSIVERLMRDYSHIEATVWPVVNPLPDLVALRNSQLNFKEKYGFIVDSDEYHYDAEHYRLGDMPAYSFQCWAVWNETHAHRSSSRPDIGRIFRRHPGLEWRGRFGKEVLYNGSKRVFDNAIPLPFRYIHFTHLKKDSWREELKQSRVADGKYLSLMPKEIISVIKKVHAQMPSVQYRQV